MDRAILKDLHSWRNSMNPTPILLRGARQVGKSYIIQKLGSDSFSSTLTVNFERQPQLQNCFVDLIPTTILERLFLATGQRVTPGETLLFLDEIQDCPQAIMAMRYFKEELPQLHVIGAGSLLEFTLRDEHFRMPVGRVKSLYLRPLSFYEYLNAMKLGHLRDYLGSVSTSTIIDQNVHLQLLDQLKKFFFIGGMPGIVQKYLDIQDLFDIQAMQTDLMTFYRRDFGKYAKHTDHSYMQRILERLPGIIGERCKYSKIDPDLRSRELKQAIAYLVEAGLIHKIKHTSASGLPLNAGAHENHFKLIGLDIGLINAMSYLPPELLLKGDLMQINRGALAEQFVGQEILSFAPAYLPGELLYWEREKVGSMAEVDYVIQIDDQIIPVEVKSGVTGRLKSLQRFLDEKNAAVGIRASLHPFSFDKQILSIPLYMLAELPRLVRQINN